MHGLESSCINLSPGIFSGSVDTCFVKQLQSLTVEGRLLDRIDGAESSLILRTGSLVLRVRVQSPNISPELRRGSLLEVTGILQAEGRTNQNSFRIALPTAENARVTQAASWGQTEDPANSTRADCCSGRTSSQTCHQSTSAKSPTNIGTRAKITCFVRLMQQEAVPRGTCLSLVPLTAASAPLGNFLVVQTSSQA